MPPEWTGEPMTFRTCATPGGTCREKARHAPNHRIGSRGAFMNAVLPGPAVDIYRADGALRVIAEVPGFSIGEIELDASAEVLRISGSRKPCTVSTEPGLVMECLRGDFSRCVVLPEDVDPASATAVLSNGLLEIVLPLAAGGGPVKIRLDEQDS